MIGVILIGIIAGMFKAMRDTIDHHWDKSTFRNIKDVNVRTWFYHDWKRKYKYPFHYFYVFALDGWHCGDFFQILFLMLTGFYMKDSVDFCILFASFFLSFNVFYKIFFIEE